MIAAFQDSDPDSGMPSQGSRSGRKPEKAWSFSFRERRDATRRDRVSCVSVSETRREERADLALEQGDTSAPLSQ